VYDICICIYECIQDVALGQRGDSIMSAGGIMSMSIWKELTVPADDRDHEKAKSKQPERRDKN